MEEEEGGSDTRSVASILVGLRSGLLSSRVSALQDAITICCEASASNNTKAGPLKRLVENILVISISDQFRARPNEKKFPGALEKFFKAVMGVEMNHPLHLPFPFIPFCADVLSSRLETIEKYDSSSLLHIGELALTLLKFCGVTSSSDFIDESSLVSVLSQSMNKLSSMFGTALPDTLHSRASQLALRKVQELAHSHLCTHLNQLPVFFRAWFGPLLKDCETVSCDVPQGVCIPGMAVLFCEGESSYNKALLERFQKAAPRATYLTVVEMLVSSGTVIPDPLTASAAKDIVAASSVRGGIVSLEKFMKSISIQEWNDVEVHLIKMLKKSPESSVLIISTVCSSSSVTLDNLLVEALGSQLPRLLRSTAPEVRESALHLIELCVHRCCNMSSDSAIAILTNIFCESLLGKPVTADGRLKAPSSAGFLLTQDFQKTSILDGLDICVATIPRFSRSQHGEGVHSVVSCALTSLFASIEKEKESSLRYRMAKLASRWILCQSTLNSVAVSSLEKLLASKTNSTSALLCLNALFSIPLSGNSSEYATAIAETPSLLNPLVKFITHGKDKPQVANVDAVLSLRVLLEVRSLVAISKTVDDSLMSNLKLALPIRPQDEELSFLCADSLHSQIVKHSSSTSSSNGNPARDGILEALLTIVGICCRDHGEALQLFTSAPMLDTDLSDGFEFSHVIVKLTVLCVASFKDHVLFKRISQYWLSAMLRACSHYNSVNSENKAACNQSLLGSFSLLRQFLEQLRRTEEYKQQRSTEDLMNFKGKESGTASLSLPVSRPSNLEVCALLETPSSRLRDVFFAFLPLPDRPIVVNDVLCSHVFSVSLQLVAHPALSNYSFSLNFRMFRELTQQHLCLPSVEEQNALVREALHTSIVGCVFPGDLTDMHASSNRKAAGNAILLLSQSSTSMSHSLFPKLIEEMNCDSISQLDKEEIEVWKNPDCLINEVEKTIVNSVEDLKITNADRKKASARGVRRGQFGSDFTEDDEWTEQIIKEKKEKRLKSAMLSAQNSPEMSKAIQRTNDISKRVGYLLQRSKFALELLQHLTNYQCDGIESNAINFINPLLSLICSPLISVEAMQSLHSVAGALLKNTPLERIKLEVVRALEIVATVIFSAGKDKRDDSAVMKEVSNQSMPITKTLHFLHAIVSNSQTQKAIGDEKLSGCFQLVFPVLRGVLCLKHQLPGTDNAFTILSVLWKLANRSTESAKRCRCLLKHAIETTLSVASHSPKQAASAGEFLLTLVEAALHPLEWTPILGVHGLLSVQPSIRRLAISAASTVANQEVNANASGSNDSSSLPMKSQPLVVSRIWLSCHDEDDAVKDTARNVWSVAEMTLPMSFMSPLLPLLESSSTPECTRQRAATALAEGMKIHQDCCHDCVSTLKAVYVSFLPKTLEKPAPQISPVEQKKSSVVATPSIGQVRNSLSSSRNKASVSKKSAAIDISSIGVGKKKSAAKKVGAVGSSIGLGAKPTKKSAKPSSDDAPVVEHTNKARKADDLSWDSRVVIADCFRAIGTSSSFAADEDSDSNADKAHVTALLNETLSFLLVEGVTDPKEEVRSKMVAAGRALIDSYGLEYCSEIVSLLEATLAEPQPDEKELLERYDLRHEAAVILLGAAAKHLDKDDDNVKAILESLVTSLNTPVESVQKAIADCLVPLVQARKTEDRIKQLIEELIERAVDGATYGTRRGAAYGLSAFVKGSGIPAIKNHDIVSRLKEFASSGSVSQRQGALFAFELLSDRLGMLFEPYVITIVPLLLKSFSHSSDLVREAAQLGAKTIMGRLSSHGVKQVLTPILQSLPTESQWKSRQEALRLLGSMAFCAPRQLANCLPQLIPRLVEACSDPHPKVKEGAKAALADISSVIRNPEVSRLSPTLLGALTDPASQTKTALEALLECEFMHSIDAPSLALLIPILARALKDRGGDLKRKSAVILGNMASMISDPKILSPYLPQVIPGLKDVLLDPIPDVRATSAKALGGLMLGMGESELPDLVPWCLKSLSVETSPVERSGAAQGLAEVCLALGDDRVDGILEDALQLQDSPSSASREGLLWLLAFLPAAMEEKFAVNISRTLPVVLKGLSDNTEGVREVAMRSGKVFVNCHGRSHSAEVLPPLLSGMFSSDWRIRESSVTLLGELLCLIGETKGISPSQVDSDDAEGGTTYLSSLSKVIVTIREHVGQELTDEILSSLYVVRSDSSVSVRQCALQVWKSVVSNTPKVLRDIMPTLVQKIISMLSSNGEANTEMFEPDVDEHDDEEDDESQEDTAVRSGESTSKSSEQSTVAGRALGELVRKLGDHVLPLIIPYLQSGLGSPTDHLRQGVCLGLSEILKAASAKQITTYIDTLVPALQQAVSDTSSHVRSLAAQAFHALAKAIGHQAFDSVLPPLLESVSSEYCPGGDASFALLGLEDIAHSRPRDVLEYLVPILLQSPLQAWAADALGRLAKCSNKSIHYHYASLIPSLIFELGTATFIVEQMEKNDEICEKEKERLDAVKFCAGAVVGASTVNGINFLVSELGKQIEQAQFESHSANPPVTSATSISPVASRQWGCWMLGQFFIHSNIAQDDISQIVDYIPLFLKYLLARSADMDEDVLQAVVESLKALAKSVSVEVLVTHVDFIRSCINLTSSDAKHRVGKDKERLYDSSTGQFILPLFRVPKALENLLPIFIHALMNGSVEQREIAASGIGELASMTEPALLKPYLIKTTGPLIRVVGDRFPSNVKLAILETLCVLLQKGGIGLKAFVPQLQTTFLKCLSDPSKQVRSCASNCLGILVPMSTRIDPLLSELSSGVQGAESSAICVSFAEGISSVLQASGKKASDEVLERVSRALLVTVVSDDEQVRTASAEALGCVVQWCSSSQQVSDIILDLIPPGGTLSRAGDHWTASAGRVLGCAQMLRYAGALRSDVQTSAVKLIQAALDDDKVSVRVAGCRALELIATPYKGSDDSTQEQLCAAVLSLFAKKLVKASERTGLADDSLEVRRAAVGALKQFSKYHQPICVEYSGMMAKALYPYVVPSAEINFKLKRSVERTLKYLLGVRRQGAKSESSAMSATSTSAAAALQNVSSADAEVGRFMQDFSRKVLSKLGDESDSEI